MSVFSDLVAAPASSAGAIGKSRSPARQFNGIDIKGVDLVKLASLHSIFAGENVASLLPTYKAVGKTSETGPWVFELPAPFVTMLAALNESGLSSAAASWARTKEFMTDRWAKEDVHAVLEAICSIAKQAEAAGHSVFLWMSL